MRYLYRVTVAPGLRYDCLGSESLHLKQGDEVIVRCERYQDFGVISACQDHKPVDETRIEARRSESPKGRKVEGQRVPRIIRRATLVDKSRAHENEVREKSMHRSALKKIDEHRLDMKLVNTHCSFDRRLIVFQFSAEGRVDFRDLLRGLSDELHTRVELRQIGVRDEAGIQGGIGSCGRPFCCAAFLSKFVSINVKMAKRQGLSLNPSNISGACGRLKCCLHYEADWYADGVHKDMTTRAAASAAPKDTATEEARAARGEGETAGSAEEGGSPNEPAGDTHADSVDAAGEARTQR